MLVGAQGTTDHLLLVPLAIGKEKRSRRYPRSASEVIGTWRLLELSEQRKVAEQAVLAFQSS
jgi:hypothetical protein